MTIRTGEPWGQPVERPPDLRRIVGDAELADALAGPMGTPVSPAGGDLYRALGSPPDRASMQRLAIDAMRVELDDRTVHAIAHVIARRGWWRGGITAVLNVDHVGAWNVAPRAHPNDGRLDVVEVAPAMTVRQRVLARGRLRAGTHLPHPCIAVRTATSIDIEFARPRHVWVDGVRIADTRRLRVAVVPDAHTVLV